MLILEVQCLKSWRITDKLRLFVLINLSHFLQGTVKPTSEYNIIFPTIEKTGRNPCSVREQIIGIAVVSKRDFDNVTCDWSCGSYAL